MGKRSSSNQVSDKEATESWNKNAHVQVTQPLGLMVPGASCASMPDANSKEGGWLCSWQLTVLLILSLLSCIGPRTWDERLSDPSSRPAGEPAGQGGLAARRGI